MSDEMWGPSVFRYRFMQDWLRKGAKEMQDDEKKTRNGPTGVGAAYVNMLARAHGGGAMHPHEKREKEEQQKLDDMTARILMTVGRLAQWSLVWDIVWEGSVTPEALSKVTGLIIITNQNMIAFTNLLQEQVGFDVVFDWECYDTDCVDVFTLCNALSAFAKALQTNHSDPSSFYNRVSLLVDAWGHLAGYAEKFEIELTHPPRTIPEEL